MSNQKPPLHNFSLPPTLKWANQRLLRCSKPSSSSSIPSSPQSPRSNPLIEERERENQSHHFEDSSPSSRPWNLRTRRAACPENRPNNTTSSSPLRREKMGSPSCNTNSRLLKKEKERAKFSVFLSKDEIELDFLTMFGTRPNRRPKKRPRISQRQVDFVCPGLWLTEITADRYKVEDLRESVKLKG